jgi:folate-binding protein YgfZ
MPSTSHLAASDIPTSDLAAELRAILTGAAVNPLNDLGWLRITGPDATRWLNGMVTNAVNALAPGEGCYNFLLNAQGRILGDCTIYRDPTPEPPAFLLQTDASQVDAIQEHLDRFIIMDDVELAKVNDRQAGILIAGPQALRTVHQLGGTPCSTAADDVPLRATLQLKQTAYAGSRVTLIRAYSPLVPHFEIWANPEVLAAISDELARAPTVTPTALEALRILSGTPRYGVDIRNTDKVHDLPQETAQDRALHFSKGCYLGQEIVERIRSRGSVHRTFTGFLLTGDPPPAGTELSAESAPRPVGELTSITSVPRAAIDLSAQPDAKPFQLALGYLRREVLDRNLPLSYPGGTAVPASLPFKLP